MHDRRSLFYYNLKQRFNPFIRKLNNTINSNRPIPLDAFIIFPMFNAIVFPVFSGCFATVRSEEK